MIDKKLRKNQNPHESRFKRAAKMYGEGMTYGAIGTELGFDARTVSAWFKAGKCQNLRTQQAHQFVMPPLKMSDPKIQRQVTENAAVGSFSATAMKQYKALWFALDIQLQGMLGSGALEDFKPIKEGVTTQMMLSKYITEYEAATPQSSTLDEIEQMNELQKRRAEADKAYRSAVNQG